jgi:2-polyprenyl-6-methoxyphenol hydroxylase-like FAD-dependent oxidoreductase
MAVDRAEFPRHKICSEYMSPEGIRHLASLGVLEAIERQGGHPIRGTTVHAPRGARLTGLFARAGHAPFRETGLSVSRWVLDHALVLAARAAGAQILERTSVRGILRESGGVAGLVIQGTRGSPREVRARLTIGADGLHSFLAREIGARRNGWLRRYAFVAHLAGVSGLGDTAEMHVAPHGYVGLNPLGAGIANVALVVPAASARDARGRAEEFFHQALQRFPGVRGRLRRSDTVREVLVSGPFDAWSRRVIGDGVVLVGDAADFFDPFTGEGLCAAMRGAEMVEAAALPALDDPGPVRSRALRPYAVARRRAFLGKWVVERTIGYAMLSPSLFDRAVERLERRGLAHTLIGVTGDFVPPRAVLNPVFLSQVVF